MYIASNVYANITLHSVYANFMLCNSCIRVWLVALLLMVCHMLYYLYKFMYLLHMYCEVNN